jgi:two-component system chemotaxis response regulator CheY
MPTREATQETLQDRLEAMGVDVAQMPGGRCLLARMRLQRSRFETTGDPLQIDEVVFATVGPNGAKCLKPRALFQLPILRIRECRDATALEACIHVAWQRHLAQLTRTEKWLGEIGMSVQRDEDRCLLAFSLGGEDPEARARMLDPSRVILPGRGPLSGIALQRAEDRSLAIDPQIQTSSELEIHISNRLAELARLNVRLSQQERIGRSDDEACGEPQAHKERSPVVLLVGPKLNHESGCMESLRLHGYNVTSAAGEREAITRFDRCSPELVFTDVLLGRSEGIDLIHSVRRVPGIEEVPVIVIDTRKREDRRETARRMGAAGYLVYPIDVPRIAEHLSQLVSEPRRRRFTRYAQRVAVKIEGTRESLFTTAIGRGGMFLATEAELPTHEIRTCELALPDLDTRVRVEAEILYRSAAGQNARAGVGVCFRTFQDSSERAFIEYLRSLHLELPSASA